MAQLSFKNIYKKYDHDVTIVKDFNLEVNDGEFIVLVGPSGCGKSTTLRMIAGLEEISEGDFYIDGKRVNDITPKDRDIAMVFQNYALYPHMTVYENMAFGLKLRKYSKDEIDQRVQHAAKILGLEQVFKPKAKSTFRWAASACCLRPSDCSKCKSIFNGRAFIKLRCEITRSNAC